uniref:Uncharacterized protein n=1 Tax=Geospiza parvula TaxID=87175 RepID=A0A8U8B7I5_GEOPR
MQFLPLLIPHSRIPACAVPAVPAQMASARALHWCCCTALCLHGCSIPALLYPCTGALSLHGCSIPALLYPCTGALSLRGCSIPALSLLYPCSALSLPRCPCRAPGQQGRPPALPGSSVPASSPGAAPTDYSSAAGG